ncbi:MAG: c-type cytochrome, partial [Pseudomonadales bacterium]
GEFGADTWPEESRKTAGGANSWAGIAIDHERGIAFAPTGSATFDFYGGDRAGDNLFANSLLALDAATGKRLWHYQFVRHDLWDRDLPSPPNLITLRRNGESIPAVAQATKTGHIFVFHRETGQPLFPIEEVPVMGEALPEEHAAETQPLPLLPPPFVAQVFLPTDRDTEMTAAVVARQKRLDPHATFRLPSLNGTILYPGMDGGAEWGGAAYDAEPNRLYINSNEVPYLLGMTAIEGDLQMGPKFAYLMVCSGCHGADMKGDGVSVPSLQNLSERLSPLEAYRVLKQGRGRMPAFDTMTWYEIAAVLWHVYQGEGNVNALNTTANDKVANAAGANYINAGYQKFLDPDGLPASRPPWGALTAIDLDTATIAWRIPFGDYPKLLEQGISGLGSENYGGPIVTASGLLFIAATPDRKLKAYDTRNSELLWSVELPAAGFATPATYAANGRQFVVIAAGGGKLGEPSDSEYIAYALPK